MEPLKKLDIRICKICLTTKGIKEFPKCGNGRRYNVCKKCNLVRKRPYMLDWAKKNRSKVTAYQKKPHVVRRRRFRYLQKKMDKKLQPILLKIIEFQNSPGK